MLHVQHLGIDLLQLPYQIVVAGVIKYARQISG